MSHFSAYPLATNILNVQYDITCGTESETDQKFRSILANISK